jgi:hypothetical protein
MRSCILFAMFIALRGSGHQGEVRVTDHFEVRVDTANPGEDLMGMFWWLRENTRGQKRYVSHYYPPGGLRALTFVFDHEQDAAAFAARFGE